MPNTPIDYRPKEILEGRTAYEGSFHWPILILAPSLLFVIIVNSTGEAWSSIPGEMFIPFVAFPAIVLAIYFACTVKRIKPDTLIEATPTPLPDLSAPAGTNFRVTLVRRRATYTPANQLGYPKNYTRHELLCWLVPSEATVEIIKSSNLLDYHIAKADWPAHEIAIVKQHKLDVDPVFLFSVRDFLEQHPVIISTEDAHKLVRIEHDVREGLQNLNNAIMEIVEPPASSGTFEL